MKNNIKKTPATLKDIATMVGVDASTVSRAINHPERVKEETLLKIQHHIEELNYHPNLVARGLQTAKSNLIAMIVPNFSNHSFAKITKGFHDALKGTGYELIICSSHEDPDEEIELSKALIRQRVSGIVFVGTVSTYEKDIPFHLFDDNMEVLVIDREIDLDNINVFLFDAYHGIKLAFNHLLQLGHRDIAIITGQERTIQSKNRIALIRGILQELGIEIPPEYIKEGDWTANGAWHAMEDFLMLDPRPTAVFAITDTMAMGAIGAAGAAGLRIPEDISIIGFNNELGSESYNPPLTTIGPHAYNIGKQAAKVITEGLDKGSHKKFVKKFPLDLIIRKSTAPITQPSFRS
jgi:DNA-binding LacI/PurR family transcriptional regulator